jgi:hypothetical protein
MPVLCRPSRRNRPIENSSRNALPAAIVDPPPTPAHSESLARAAPPSNRHRRPPPAPPTAGSFPGGFRKPALQHRWIGRDRPASETLHMGRRSRRRERMTATGRTLPFNGGRANGRYQPAQQAFAARARIESGICRRIWKRWPGGDRSSRNRLRRVCKDFEISHRAEPVQQRTYKVGACQALGEPRFPHFSTLPGGQLSASVSRLPASGGS